MFTLLRDYRIKHLASTELPSLVISLLVAELFYKFHSFTVEALAFFVTWFVVSLILRILLPTHWSSRTTEGERT